MFKIKKIVNLQMDMNSYMLIKQGSVIVIDPGLNGDEILSMMKDKALKLEAILLTHGHFDHIRDITKLLEVHSCDIYIHEADHENLYHSKKNYASSFGQSFTLDKSFTIKTIEDNDDICILDESIKVIHTPGHTFGSVMFQYNDQIFSGDTIFYDGIGRTDLFSGNFNAIRRTINMIKNTVSNQSTFWPGHGPHGLLKDIKKVNRFLQ
jgi:glyoxylase-like metal-dependent hydrolase (beta-lactamase superfamily II)